MAINGLIPPNISIIVPIDIIFTALKHHNRFDRRASIFGKRAIDGGLQRNDSSTTPAAIRCNNDPGTRIIHSISNRIRAKTTKNHTMNEPEASAGQHRHWQLGNHWHVDNDPVTTFQPLSLQRIGEALDVG